MAITTRNWTLVTYTVTTWTNLVSGLATVASLNIANTDLVNAIDVSIRLSGGCVLQPPVSIEPGGSYVADIRSLNVMAGEQVQVMASAVGLNVLASGITY